MPHNAAVMGRRSSSPTGERAPGSGLYKNRIRVMIDDLSLSALFKAWATTITACGLLLAALSTAQIWNSEVYWHSLVPALALAEAPPPLFDPLDEPIARPMDYPARYAARAGQTGSWEPSGAVGRAQ